LVSSEPEIADSKCDWYVAYTQPKREQVAVFSLEQQDFEALSFPVGASA
jgi:hypothetical protein